MANKIFGSILVFGLMTGGLFAGGWNNTLMGSRALAIGAAFSAIADNPSAIHYNPAGLALQQNRLNLTIGGFYVRPTHEFVLPSGSTAYSRNNVAFPQFFLSYQVSERVTLGLGAYIPFAGGGVDWHEDELGFPFKSALGIMSVTPSFSYRITDKFSMGVNVFFYRGILDVNTENGPYGPMTSEESGSALSAGIGFMYRPSDRLNLGLNIRGPANMALSGKTAIPVTIPELGTVDLKFPSETKFSLPWDLEFGISYRLNDKFLLAANMQYTMWAVLDKVEKTIKNIPVSGEIKVDEKLDFKNILILRAGFEYAVPGGIFLRGGIGIDRSASPNETLSITNIDVDKAVLLGGIGYRFGQMQIDFVYALAKGWEREKNISSLGMPLQESYNLNTAVLGMDVTFSF